jgi:hypothetical protein
MRWRGLSRGAVDPYWSGRADARCRGEVPRREHEPTARQQHQAARPQRPDDGTSAGEVCGLGHGTSERVVFLDMRLSQPFVNHPDNAAAEDPSFE